MRIAIIGNGPSPIGKSYGSAIDSMDIVIRMHDCHLLGNEEDYGAKYDYGIIPSPWFRKAVSQIRIMPDKGWLIYALSKQRVKRIHPKTLYGIECSVTAIDSYIGDILGNYRPTRGLCAIVLSILYFKPNAIYLVGFDSVLSGRIVQYHSSFPFQEKDKFINTKGNDEHDYSLEKKIVFKLSESNKIPIQDISSCI